MEYVNVISEGAHGKSTSSLRKHGTGAEDMFCCDITVISAMILIVAEHNMTQKGFVH